MKSEHLNTALIDLEEIAKFFKFGRKNIKEKIISSLDHVDAELTDLQNCKIEMLKENSELVNFQKRMEEEYKAVKEKYDLVSELLSTKPVYNETMVKFRELVNRDFIEFANNESSLAEEAQALLMMQRIESDIELLVNFPKIYNKNTIAIGGGFSSGKSAFVNSFFQENLINLPIGIEPVTAIPTYVVSEEIGTIKGFSNNGGSINIDAELYERLSHKFVKSFSFNLKDIMPFVAIGTSLDQKLFKHLCLIDTPGYNPSLSDSYSEEDKDTSKKLLDRASALIWMIGLDSNGTLPASDLNFLKDLDLSNKSLLVVANKADLKSESDLKAILLEIEEVLTENDIEFDGITTYSASERREFLFIKTTTEKFLKKLNNPTQIKVNFNERVDRIFDMYKAAIESDVHFNMSNKKNLKSLELDIMQSDIEFSDDAINNRIQDMKDTFDVKELKSHLKKAEILRSDIKSCIAQIFVSLKME